MLYIQQPNKKPKDSPFEKQISKLKNTKFTQEQFQKARSSSKISKIEKYFLRIGICLNNQSVKSLSNGSYDKVCFIISNTYINEKLNLGVGPLNDGYMVGLHFYKLGYKIFYIINPLQRECEKFLQFFVKNSGSQFVIYFTGRIGKIRQKDNMHDLPQTAMLFDDGHLFDDEVISLLTQNKSESENKIVLISDSPHCEPICSFKTLSKSTLEELPNTIILSPHRNSPSIDEKIALKRHGLFSFYLCKYLKQDPSISLQNLELKINSELNRFDETVQCEVQDPNIIDCPLFE